MISHMISHGKSSIRLVLERIEDTPCVCRSCGKEHRTPVHSIDTVIVEDLPISGKRVFLHVPKRRTLCLKDGRIRTEEIQWLRGQVTRRFADHVYRLTSIKTNTEVGWFLGLDDEKVYWIDKGMLEELSSLNERVYKAMLLKEQFLRIYQEGDHKAAYANLCQWIVAVVKSGMQSFVELGYKFFRKRHYVLNYFICKITAGISEGINNKIKRLKRMVYGYREVKYFLLKIHQHCGLLSPGFST